MLARRTQGKEGRKEGSMMRRGDTVGSTASVGILVKVVQFFYTCG